jgi:hypothetical protein
MNTSKDPILFERREELKRQIAAGEYKSLLDVISDQVGRAIQRLTKSTQPLPFWYSATVIALIILIVDFLTSLVFGEFSAARHRSIWAELSVSGVIVVGLTALRTYLDRVYATLRENILDSMGSAEDVADLGNWFASMAKVKQPLMFSVACTFLVNLPISLAGAALVGGFISYGAVVLFVGVGIGGGIFLWYIALFLSLALRLSRYRFDLYAADPSASEVIRHLSNLFNSLVFMLAVVMALFTLLWASSPEFLFSGLMIVSVLTSWGPVVTLFVFSQAALSRIIMAAKWEKLRQIQKKAERLESQEDIPSRDTLAHICALMDYHDRIMGARSLALDVRTGLNLLNSLLLPLLAFLVSNLRNVLALFLP